MSGLADLCHGNQFVIVVQLQSEATFDTLMADKTLQNGGRKLYPPSVTGVTGNMAGRALVMTQEFIGADAQINNQGVWHSSCSG